VDEILYVLLAVAVVQTATAVWAFARGRRSSKAGAPSHAGYSLAHGALLLGGAVVLAVPVVLGLADVISATTAVIVAVVLEVAALVLSREVVKRLESAHQARRPSTAL
jgi:hypothetical protein